VEWWRGHYDDMEIPTPKWNPIGVAATEQTSRGAEVALNTVLTSKEFQAVLLEFYRLKRLIGGHIQGDDNIGLIMVAMFNMFNIDALERAC